jgi:hypothetical protein
MFRIYRKNLKRQASKASFDFERQNGEIFGLTSVYIRATRVHNIYARMIRWEPIRQIAAGRSQFRTGLRHQRAWICPGFFAAKDKRHSADPNQAGGGRFRHGQCQVSSNSPQKYVKVRPQLWFMLLED